MLFEFGTFSVNAESGELARKVDGGIVFGFFERTTRKIAIFERIKKFFLGGLPQDKHFGPVDPANFPFSAIVKHFMSTRIQSIAVQQFAEQVDE
jgi:hypothetical protein